ncbi:MAG: glycosyl transferase, group 2 family protein [Candidatus Eremiobacteraeota bacterium]|nr:glycosyl transferase, group 2 family protein [Candidatus Eremiobacteraeota bacterium]
MESARRDAPGVLIASAFGDDGSGGGLFAVDGSRAERIDRIATTGLAYDGRRLARNLRCPPPDALLAEIVVYDERGVVRYMRLDVAAAVHDVAWDGENVVVVSPWHNAVQWFSPAGELVREVRYPGPSDAWHVNCITRHGDTWYATLFGDFGTFRGWDTPAHDGQGRIVELTTGTTVVAGLTTPHTPRWVDGMWLVCNSGNNELLAFDEQSGRVVRRVPCDNWTRGIAYDDDFFYVGACRRSATLQSYGESQIVVIDRRTWALVDRITVPAREIYDLAFVPPSLGAGLRRGFDVNPLRTSEFRQYRMLTEIGAEQPHSLWPSGDPLPWSDFRCSITCEFPPRCTADEMHEVAVRVANRSRSFFTSAPPAPVYASYKWLDRTTGAYLSDGRAYRSKLPRTVFPAETVDMTMRIVVPHRAGAALLRITLMQEGITWFDDQDPASGTDFAVEIAPAGRRAAAPAPIVR